MGGIESKRGGEKPRKQTEINNNNEQEQNKKKTNSYYKDLIMIEKKYEIYHKQENY